MTEIEPQADGPRKTRSGRISTLLKRFLTPSVVTTLYYLVRHRAKVSHRAEVDLSPNLKLGRGTTVSSFSKVKASGGPVEVGPRGGFAIGCFVSAGYGGVRIGKNLICGPNVNIVASNYVYEKPGIHLEDQGSVSKGIRIGDNVWIGAGTTVLDGSVIGDNCIVVANSLVNRRFPDNVIIQGNPAKVIMKRATPDADDGTESASKADGETRAANADSAEVSRIRRESASPPKRRSRGRPSRPTEP